MSKNMRMGTYKDENDEYHYAILSDDTIMHKHNNSKIIDVRSFERTPDNRNKPRKYKVDTFYPHDEVNFKNEPIYVIGYIKKRIDTSKQRWYFKLINKNWDPKESQQLKEYEKTSKYITPIRGMIKDNIKKRIDDFLINEREYSIEDIYNKHYRKIVVIQAFEENKLTGKIEWMKSSLGKTFTEKWEGLILESYD